MRELPAEVTRELDGLLGTATDRMPDVDQRLRARFGPDTLVWEGDAQTFQYLYVGDNAVAALGYPLERWLAEPAFWAEVVVHEYDRDDAVSYCALATARKQHHVFDYRARAQDGRIVWFRDYVKVLLGPRGVPTRLRGAMMDVTEAYGNVTNLALRAPTRATLDAMRAG